MALQKKLPFKSATIEYTLSGMKEGTEVEYIKDYGQRIATHQKTVTTMRGMRTENHTIDIQDQDWVYSYDLTEGTGSKNTNPMKYMIKEYEKLSAAEKKQMRKNAEQFGVGVMAGRGGTVDKNVTEILG